MSLVISFGARDKEKEVELPGTMDVLIHLPESDALRDEGLCVAHAIQYNISAKGPTPEQALSRLVDLVAVHCKVAVENGIDPINMTSGSYMKAFFLGKPIAADLADAVGQNVNARLSQELAEALDAEVQGVITVDVRSICEMQERRHVISIEDFVKMAAA
jgi:hypothetical protein